MLLSLLLCFVFNSVVIKSEKPQEIVENKNCEYQEQSKVGIFDSNKQ
jgi:hypothetical protein